MATFKVIENETADRWVESEDRLWLTADGERVVVESDPAAASLFAVPGQRISRADAIRYGLVKPDKADKAEQVEEGSELVEGKIDDILAEVGDDPEKVEAALAAERASEKPRKSLVARLEKIQAGGEG